MNCCLRATRPSGRRGTEAAAELCRRVSHLAPALLLLALAACGPSRPPSNEGSVRNAPAAAAQEDLRRIEERLVALHNREREAVGAQPLAWDADLARAAADYARVLAREGRLAHSESDARPGQGENLWMGTRGAYDIGQMVGSWIDEKGQFRPGTFPDVSETGRWQDVAHYTQMIWPGTNRLGCAVEASERWEFLVCRYAPAGNVVGERVP